MSAKNACDAVHTVRGKAMIYTRFKTIKHRFSRPLKLSAIGAPLQIPFHLRKGPPDPAIGRLIDRLASVV